MQFRSIAALLAALSLAACGGGGGGSHGVNALPTTNVANGGSAPDLSASAPHNTAPAAGAVTSNVTVQIPFGRSTSSRLKRRPQYLTPDTQGIDLEAYQNGVYSGYVFYPLTALQSNCSGGSGTTLTCTLALQAPVGSTQIIVHTYDNTTVASSNMLSVADPIETITAGTTNNLSITTLPIAASIAITANPFPRCPVFGTPTSVSNVQFTAYDADGNALTGLQLGNAINVANVNPNDANPGYTFTPSSLTAGSGSFAYAYNGTDANIGIFTISASLGPTGTVNQYLGTAASIPVGTAGPHMVYVSDSANNQILGYDACAANTGTPPSPLVYTLPTGTAPTEVRFDRNSPAGQPRLFVLGASPNNTLVWLDVTTPPGSVLQSVSLAGTPHHVQDSSTSAFVWVSFGGGGFRKFAINESSPALTASGSLTISGPQGFGLEGTGNDILLAATGTSPEEIAAVNPSTMTINATATAPPNATVPTKITGPNATATCALAADPTANTVAGITVVATGASSVGLVGQPASLPGTPAGLSYFPPDTPGTGTEGYGSTTGIVATNGGAEIVTCDGTTFAATTTWTTFMAQPAAVAPSNYASTAVPAIVYVVGLDQGVPVLQPFTTGYDHDLGSIALPSGTTPTYVTSGP